MGLLLLAGCAVGRVQQPNGPIITGWAVGHATVEYCEVGGGSIVDDGLLDPPPGTLGGGCTRIQGGALSHTFVEALSVLGTALAGMVAGGVVP